MKLGWTPESELMREATQKLELIPMMMRVKEFLTWMVQLQLEVESVMQPEQEAESEEELEKGPGLLSVKPP